MQDQNFSITFTVAYRIRQLRILHGLSQENLALSAQIAPSYLGQLERGIKTPTVETIYKLCNALNLSMSEFFTFDDGDDEGKYNLAYHTIRSSLKELPPDAAMRISLIIQELASLHTKK